MKEIVVYNPENELEEENLEENDESDHCAIEQNSLKYITYNGKVCIINYFIFRMK